MIASVENSPLKNKRFRIVLNDERHFDFGLKGGNTYIDHHDEAKRGAYRARHLANEKERHLIENLIPSPALFSFYVLWGDSTDLKKNVNELNAVLKQK